jgi:hypothetical protein
LKKIKLQQNKWSLHDRGSWKSASMNPSKIVAAVFAERGYEGTSVGEMGTNLMQDED